MSDRLKIVLIIIAAVLLSVNLLSQTTYRLHAFEFSPSAVFSHRPGTTVVLPPLGRITARTHLFPIHLSVRLENIDLNLLQGLVRETEDFYLLLFEEGKRLLLLYVLRVTLLAAFAGSMGAYLLGYRGLRVLALAGLVGILIILAGVAVIYSTYDVAAFEDPVYHGTLEAAPWMIGLIEESLFRIEELSEKLQVMSQNLYAVFERIEELQPLGTVDGDLRILHVSDIHNNVIALGFIEQLVANFAVDLIIDTGDLVDYGTPIEAELLGGIDDLGVPYIFVPGNHDSPQVVEALERLDNVEILRGQIFFGGLRIAGIADPLASSGEFRAPDADEIAAYSDELKALVEREPLDPQIIAVHNHRIAEEAEDLAPLILHGHTHTKRVHRREGGLRIDAGTTGASGIRSLETTEGSPPYSMVLLRFEQLENGFKLLAADTIQIMDRESGFNLKRYLINLDLEPR